MDGARPTSRPRRFRPGHATHQLALTFCTVLAVLGLVGALALASYISFNRSTTPLEKSISSARQAREPNPQDSAYCTGSGRLVHMVEAEGQRGVVCLDGSDLVYHGLTNATGGKIALPARMVGREVVEASTGPTTYRLSEYGLSIIESGVITGSQWANETTYRTAHESDLPGDLQLPTPISYPDCNGDIVVVTESIIGEEVARERLPNLLAQHSDWGYLRTDLSCDNFYPPSDARSGGDYIYATYFTRPYTPDNAREMCALAAREEYTVDRLQDGVPMTDRLCLDQ